VLHISRIRGLFGWLRPRDDRTGEKQTFISKTVLPNHANWDVGLILMLSGDYNFFSSSASELNNFIQYSHCQVVQLFWFTTPKSFHHIHSVYPCVRFSD